MTTTNTISPFLILTLPRRESSSECLYLNQNSSGSKFNYAITVPKNIALQTIEIYNRTLPPTARKEANAEPGVGAQQSLLSPLVLSGSGVVADFSSNIRESFSTYHKVYGTENPVALAALGFTTGFGLFSGALGVYQGVKEGKTAEKVSDTAGKALAKLQIAKGAIGAIGSSAYIPFRALSLAALSTSAKVVSVMAGVLGSFGSACFNFGSVLGAISIGIKLNEQYQFRTELNAILQDSNLSEQERPVKALEHLKKLASVSVQEKEEIRNELRSQPENQTLSPQQLNDKVEEKSSLLLQKKEACLKRVLNAECITKIREKGPAEAKEVIEAVLSECTKKTGLAIATMTLLAVGLAVTIASFVFTGPLGIIVAAATSLAASLGWFLLDGYDLIQEFKSADPGRFDKLWIYLSSILAVIAVSLVFFLSGGIAPIIAAAAVGVVWLGINSTCYYRLYKRGQLT